MKRLLLIFILLLLGFTGCAQREYTDAEYRQDALEEARQALEQYAAEHNVPIEEFDGPHLSTGEPMDDTPPRYTVFYQHPDHYFVYWASDNTLNAHPITEEHRRYYEEVQQALQKSRAKNH